MLSPATTLPLQPVQSSPSIVSGFVAPTNMEAITQNRRESYKPGIKVVAMLGVSVAAAYAFGNAGATASNLNVGKAMETISQSGYSSEVMSVFGYGGDLINSSSGNCCCFDLSSDSGLSSCEHVCTQGFHCITSCDLVTPCNSLYNCLSGISNCVIGCLR